MIRLVTFDFWQTLFTESPEGLTRTHALRLAGVREALGRAGHHVDAEVLTDADARAGVAFAAIWGQHRSMSAAEQVRMFLEAIDPRVPGALSPEHRAAVEAAYEEPALTHPPMMAPGAAEAIRWCRAQRLTLGVISNTGRTPGTVLRRLLARADVLPCFAVLSFSDEAGVRKPARAIFERTLGQARIPAEGAVHLGDDPVSDVAGARALGMRAIHYAPDRRPVAEPTDAVLRHFDELPAVLARLGHLR